MNLSIRARGTAVSVPLKAASPRAIKYAAFALTATSYVRLESAGERVRVTLVPKLPSGKTAMRKLASRFREELDLEGIRGAIEANNRRVREHVIRLALRGETSPPEAEAQESLTEEQQKELDRLIAEVEAEIRKEPGNSAKDPLGVTRTWEETHGRARADEKD